jgi:hypothetical protein
MTDDRPRNEAAVRVAITASASCAARPAQTAMSWRRPAFHQAAFCGCDHEGTERLRKPMTPSVGPSGLR